jgi:hypothetical protein
MALHIGKLIDNQIKQRGITKIALARKVKTSPQHLHYMVKRPSIDTDILSRLSVALNYNFFSHFTGSSVKHGVTADPRIRMMQEEILQARQQIEVLTRHNAYLRELLELHNSLNPGKKVALAFSPPGKRKAARKTPSSNQSKSNKSNKSNHKQTRKKV